MGIRRVENMCGGKGHVIIKDILEGDELKGKCGLYAQVTIEKGCSLGYHEHHGETETYYILSGEGEYDYATLRDGLRETQLCEATLRSAQTGGWVDVSQEA